MARQSKDRTSRYYLKFYGPGALLVILSFLVAYQFVQPAPPRHIVIATGQPEGSYYHFGQEYRQILARDGIDLEVRVTAGAVENLRLLENGEVDVAFLQGGMGTLARSDALISLGSLYYEPVWVFYRADLPIKGYTGVKGLRIDIGGKETGGRIVAQQVLDFIGITPQNTPITDFGGQRAADMLLEGRLDFAFMVQGYQAPVVQQLLHSDAVLIWSWRRVKAFARHFHYMTIVTLPEGFVDFAANIPPQDIKLVAATTQLVGLSGLHPALIDILLLAAQEVHGGGGLFEDPGEFPAPKQLDFKLTRETQRFYRSGPTFLRRYLPFWLATFVDRMKILLLPLAAFLLPFFKVMPALYRWRARSKIYRWYRELEELDPEFHHEMNLARMEEHIERLNQIEKQVSQIPVPLAYREQLYDLRLHIDLLRNKLVQACGEARKQG
jgi:TRAP transporter TAXI family solute receptor